MFVSKKKRVFLALALLTFSCGKKDKRDDASTTLDDGTYTGSGDPANQVVVAGTINISALALAEKTVTHVIALNTETGATSYTDVDDDGSYSLKIDKNEPWFLSYVNGEEEGADMIVSTFAAGTLDTISAGDDSDGIEMGTVDASGDRAKIEGKTADLLEEMAMSEDAAAIVGAVDDTSLRYSNPDIDNNGKIDAEEEKSYLVDFHNRFTASDSSNNPLDIDDMKDKFYPNDVNFTYTGTGIMPQIPKDDLGGTAPDTYKWQFSVDMVAASNGGQVCDGMSAGDTIPKNTDCKLDHENDTGASDGNFTFGMETTELKAGDYTLKVGKKTYQWTNVAVSDFSAGEGFLALFIKLNTSGGKLTGLSYKWQIKGSDGKYSLADEEAIKLIVKKAETDEGDFGGYVSLKYKGDESKGSLGIMIPREQKDDIVFKTAIEKDDGTINVEGSELTEAMVKAGVSFTDFTENPGISYDDKLGMRFFF
jgi:hypothetical protein